VSAPKDQSIRRAAYSPAEFAALCGRHPSWAYRLLYGGKVSALTDLGRILIPASELERVLSSAAPYDPKPRKAKTQPAESGATIGDGGK
jgi:Helix-turn-helix domain